MSPIDAQSDERGAAAVSWFDESLAAGEWVNHSWIGRYGPAELRMVDIVCADASHRLLVRVVPSTDPVIRLAGLDYDEVQHEVDRFAEIARANGFTVGEFAGPATSLPWYDEAMASQDNPKSLSGSNDSALELPRTATASRTNALGRLPTATVVDLAHVPSPDSATSRGRSVVL